MKIIDVGTVIDILDPQGIGRIRYFSFDDNIATKQRAYTGPAWDKSDPTVALPFLPTHINIIPEVKGAVKIIKHIAETDGLTNQEYIPGPFTTSHDFPSQSFSSQLTYTSYGVGSTPKPDIKSFSGSKLSFEDNYVEAKSVGTMAKLGDIAINGNYGSDLLLTEGGAQLRAGKFISKETRSKTIKEKLSIYPYRGRKEAKLSLKKYPYTAELFTETTFVDKIGRMDLKHIVEYDLNDFESPTGVTMTIYEVITGEGDKYKTDIFNQETTNFGANIKLIYQDEIEVDSIEEAYAEVRTFIANLDNEKMNVISATLPNKTAHPFYFRPVVSPNSLVRRETPTNLGKANKVKFLENIVVKPRKNYGLFFDETSADPVISKLKKTNQYVRNKNIVYDAKGKILREDYIEQSIGSVMADKFFILSTETNGGSGKSVDFPNLNKYELDQFDYIERIEPNTWSSVRGEKLIEILELMVEMLLEHRHGIGTTPAWPQALKDKIRDLKTKMPNDMVNKSIRIN